MEPSGRRSPPAVPDGRHHLERFLVDGAGVSVEGTYEGTHTSRLVFGAEEIPASGNRLGFPFASVITFEGDQIVTVSVYFDTMAMMAQMGAVSV
ncbi:MAG: hypothetical protein GEU71_17450 [Actinobacteria bacterium]|nr:hypothetical protein [Actinomycetota bacterium]